MYSISQFKFFFLQKKFDRENFLKNLLSNSQFVVSLILFKIVTNSHYKFLRNSQFNDTDPYSSPVHATPLTDSSSCPIKRPLHYTSSTTSFPIDLWTCSLFLTLFSFMKRKNKILFGLLDPWNEASTFGIHKPSRSRHIPEYQNPQEKGSRFRSARSSYTCLCTWCFSDRASWIDYTRTLITNLMHWLLFIHKILLSSTCFEHQVLIFRRT